MNTTNDWQISVPHGDGTSQVFISNNTKISSENGSNINFSNFIEGKSTSLSSLLGLSGMIRALGTGGSIAFILTVIVVLAGLYFLIKYLRKR